MVPNLQILVLVPVLIDGYGPPVKKKKKKKSKKKRLNSGVV